MKKHEILENKMCKELDSIEEKYRSGVEMSEADLRKIDMIVHALKSLATYEAMKEAEEYQEYEQSFAMQPQYMSRNSYNTMSGHYPPPFYPNQPRRW